MRERRERPLPASEALFDEAADQISAGNLLASPADILSGSSRNHSSPHEHLLQPVATSVQANWPITGRLPFFVKRDFDLKFISRVHVNMRTSLRSSILCPRNFVFGS